jgi:membrane protease YdiL (CAAX protease family)
MPSVPPPQAIPQPSPPQPADGDRRADDEPPWRVWTAPASVALGLGTGLVASIVVGIVARAGGASLAHPTPAVSLIGDFVFDLAFVWAALYFARIHASVNPADFGFRAVRVRFAAGAVVIAAISYYVVTALYASALHLHGNEKLPREFRASHGATLAALTVFVCVVAPIAEEFFFRGFFFGALRRWRIIIAGRNIGTWVAAVLTGILFGLAHTGSASPRFLIPLGFLGFVLCLVRWRTRSLYPCMALHSLNNSLALGISQLHWSAGEIVALIAGSILVITAITGPLATRGAAVA